MQLYLPYYIHTYNRKIRITTTTTLVKKNHTTLFFFPSPFPAKIQPNSLKKEKSRRRKKKLPTFPTLPISSYVARSLKKKKKGEKHHPGSEASTDRVSSVRSILLDRSTADLSTSATVPPTNRMHRKRDRAAADGIRRSTWPLFVEDPMVSPPSHAKCPCTLSF